MVKLTTPLAENLLAALSFAPAGKQAKAANYVLFIIKKIKKEVLFPSCCKEPPVRYR